MWMRSAWYTSDGPASARELSAVRISAELQKVVGLDKCCHGRMGAGD
jgi:hypothetical protein